MKTLLAAALVSVLAVAAGSARAQNADDIKWIGQCVTDNKDEGQTPAVVVAYCTCMNNKMSSNETRSITQWERANPKASEACGREAGWKGR